jgi:hypothetical protein
MTVMPAVAAWRENSAPVAARWRPGGKALWPSVVEHKGPA